jgi:hypothetical protein
VTTRLVQLLVIAIVAVGVFIAVSSVRDATEPAATVPGAVIAEAGGAAAASSLRAVAAAMEAYRVEQGTYAGATIAALLQYDRTLDPTVRIARADGAGYCVETTVASATSSLAGPGGSIAAGAC